MINHVLLNWATWRSESSFCWLGDSWWYLPAWGPLLVQLNWRQTEAFLCFYLIHCFGCQPLLLNLFFWKGGGYLKQPDGTHSTHLKSDTYFYINWCKSLFRYGYEILDAPTDRRGSVSGNSRRGSLDRGSLSPRRGSTPESRSPRRTPEPYGRGSPEANGGRRGSIGLAEARRTSGGIPARKFTPSKSPLASPYNYKQNSASSLSLGSSPRIDKAQLRFERHPCVHKLFLNVWA